LTRRHDQVLVYQEQQRLEVGKQVKWEWEMESDATDVVQLLIDKLKRAWFHS
jgi:hypothetical protein